MALTHNQTIVLSVLQKMHDGGKETGTLDDIWEIMSNMPVRSSATLINSTLLQLLKLELVSRSTPPPGMKPRGLRYKVTDKGRKQPCLSYKELYGK